MTLGDAKLSDSYIITSINIEDEKYCLRLKELGLYEGAKLKVIKFSPLKKTILVEILNSIFALKSEMAKFIEVEKIS